MFVISRCLLMSVGLALTLHAAALRAAEPPSAAFSAILAESHQRRDAAQRRLDEARALHADLIARQNEIDRRLKPIAQRVKADTDERLHAMKRQLAAAHDELKLVEAELADAKPDAFTSLDQLMRFDQATDRRGSLRESIADIERRITAATHDLLRQDPQGAELVDEWRSLAIQINAAANEAVVAQLNRDDTSRKEGSIAKAMQTRPDVEAARTLRPDVPRVGDAAARLARFEDRHSRAGIDSLGRRFFSGMNLTHPGLEQVRELVEAERFGPALEAYKRYFFARLMKAVHQQRQDGEAVNAIAALSPPTRRQLDDALAGRIVKLLSERGKTIRVEAELGQPGAMNWVFIDPPTVQSNPDGALLLSYCRQIGDPRAVGEALLGSYALGGPVEHLRHWCDIADDWSMNWRAAVEASPLPLRDYNLLYVCRIQALRSLLRMMAQTRPSFIDDMPADTLARLLMTYNEEYLASAIRLGRSGLYNFRIMALMSMIPTSLHMQEFHAHQWAVREGWRQADNNFIYKTRRDGANFEFANDGHENTDQSMLFLMQELRRSMEQPDWLDPWWDQEFLDRFTANTRYWVHNLKPDGFSYRLNVRDQRFRYLGAAPEYKVDLLREEDEVRRRLWHVFKVGSPEPEPRIASQSLAFQGYYYLRSGWKAGDDFLYFQSIGQPILSGREDDTGYSLHGRGGIHLLSPAPTVDGKTQNIHHGLINWPGGKAEFAAYGDPNTVQEGRFHAGERFDLAEGTFSGVYQHHRPGTSYDVFGSYGYEASLAKAQALADREGIAFVDEPIRDVRQSRRVLSIRGRRTYIITDLFTSDQPRSFAQHYTIYTPTRRDHVATRLRLIQEAGIEPLTLDAEARKLTTCNPGLPNMQMRHVSALPLEYRVHEDKRRARAVAAGGDMKVIDNLFSKRDRQEGEASNRIAFSHHVAVNWQSRGPAALVTIVTPQERRYDRASLDTLHDVRPIAPRQDTAGFTAAFADGTPVAYIASTQPTELSAGGVSAHASALLIVDDHGIALDCTSIAIGGKRVTTGVKDFTFRVEEGRVVVDQPIYRPIEPVVIEPASNVFIQKQTVTLSCATEGVELRYTLDGSRPTPQSTLYAGPFTIEQTTRLKVRAFRPGVTEDIWQEDGTHATVVYDTVLRKEPLRPARVTDAPNAGLRYEYIEGAWTDLMTNSVTLPATATGDADLLDVSMRKTDGAFAVRYEGVIDLPRDGVYSFHAPAEFIYPDIESGYDLRLFIDGREWYPAVRWHGHGDWSIALAKGQHAIKAVFVDMRLRPHRVELMWGFPHVDFTWKGDAPALEMSGPGLPRQPIPSDWLRH